MRRVWKHVFDICVIMLITYMFIHGMEDWKDYLYFFGGVGYTVLIVLVPPFLRGLFRKDE